MNLISDSPTYPGINMLTFSQFCENCKIFDKNFNIATADRLFIAANFNDYGEVAGNSTKELIRFEFLEIIVRIAKAKYIDTGLKENYEEALRSLFSQEFTNFTPKQSWMRWREDELWVLSM